MAIGVLGMVSSALFAASTFILIYQILRTTHLGGEVGRGRSEGEWGCRVVGRWVGGEGA